MTDRDYLPRPPMTQGIEFSLEGEVSLADFDRALKGFHQLLDALQNEVASGTEIRWIISELEASSARTVVAPELETQESLNVVEAYGRTGQALQDGTELPYKSVSAAINTFREIIGGTVEAIRFRTATVSATFENVQASARVGRTYSESYGALIGWLRTLAIPMQGLQASLRDREGRSIRCYFDDDKDGELRKLWGRYVAVEGLVKRHIATGRPVSISQITDMRVREEADPGAWREAIGIAPAADGAISSEEAVRRVRDG